MAAFMSLVVRFPHTFSQPHTQYAADTKPPQPKDSPTSNQNPKLDQLMLTLTGFYEEHPGGAKILQRVGGKDASKQFWKYHNEGILKKYEERLRVGSLKEEAKL